MSSEVTQEVTQEVDYYNNFDRSQYGDAVVVIHDLELLIPWIYGHEGTIVGVSVTFLMVYTFITIFSTNSFKIFIATSRSKLRQNLYIIVDVIRFRNPVIRLLNARLKQEYNRQLAERDYNKLMARFRQIESEMYAHESELEINGFWFKILKLQAKYSQSIGVPLYDTKQFSLLSKKFENIAKLKGMPKTYVLAINEALADDDGVPPGAQRHRLIPQFMNRMNKTNETLIIAGNTVN